MQESRSSDHAGLRAALRDHTAQTHRQLDELVGAFASAEQYGRFVASSFCFRQGTEPGCAIPGLWEPLCLLEDLRGDLVDLGVTAPEQPPSALIWHTQSEKLGALYVLEGSALGARLLLRRAEDLGFSAGFGARHLAHQSGDNARWKRFLALLDGSGLDNQAALAAAQQTFELALTIYSEAVHEFA